MSTRHNTCASCPRSISFREFRSLRDEEEHKLSGNCQKCIDKEYPNDYDTLGWERPIDMVTFNGVNIRAVDNGMQNKRTVHNLPRGGKRSAAA